MKIHIIGCSGSGKTYLANKLSQKYNVAHYDLDDIQWDKSANTYGVKTPVEKRNALLQNILQNESWVIEGVYYAWVTESFAKADIIYLLETAPHVYKSRIIKRFIKRKLGLEPGKKETFKSLVALLKWTNTFQKQNMVQINKMLQAYENKVVRLRTAKEVKNLLK